MATQTREQLDQSNQTNILGAGKVTKARHATHNNNTADYIDYKISTVAPTAPTLQQVTTQGKVTADTIQHAVATTTAQSATLGQANTVARAPYIIVNVPEDLSEISTFPAADYMIIANDTIVDVLTSLSPSLFKGRSAIMANKSDSVVSIASFDASNMFWDVDGNFKNAITVPVNQIYEFTSDGTHWIVRKWH